MDILQRTERSMNLKIKFWLFSSLLLLFILLFFGIGTLYFINFLPATIGEYLSLVIYRYFQIIFFSTIFFILSYLTISFIIYNKYIIPFYTLVEDVKLISRVNPSFRININGCQEACFLSKEINKLAQVVEDSNKRFEDKLTKSIARLREEKIFIDDVINNLPFGVVVCDLRGVVLMYNRTCRYLLEKSDRCMSLGIGRDIFGIIEKEKFLEALKDITSKRAVRFEQAELKNIGLEVMFVPLVKEGIISNIMLIFFKKDFELCNSEEIYICSLDSLLQKHGICLNDLDCCTRFYETCVPAINLCDSNYKDMQKIRLRELTYTVFDLETTGLDPFGGDEIISISAVRIANQRILAQEIFHQLVDPKRPIPLRSIKIHGIKPEMVDGKPPVECALKFFHAFAKGSVLVAYNAFFDKAFIQQKEVKAGVKFDNPILDILLLSVLIHPHQRDHSLESIAKRVGVKLYPRHTSYGDALTCAEILIKFFPLLEDKGIYTLQDAWSEMQKIKFYSRKYYSIMLSC